MMLVSIPCNNGRARRWVSRWLVEIVPGVYVGDVHPQGHMRMLNRLRELPHDGIVVMYSAGKTVTKSLD